MNWNLNNIGQGFKSAFATRADEDDQWTRAPAGHHQQAQHSYSQPNYPKRKPLEDGTLRSSYASRDGGEMRPEHDLQGSRYNERNLVERESRAPKAKSHSKRIFFDHPSQNVRRDPRDIIDDLQSDIQRRDQDIAELQIKCTKLESENIQLTDDIRLLQEKSFKTMGDARWAPMDLAVVTEELENIRDRTWKLAKEYAIASWEGLQRDPETIPTELRERLNTVVQFAEEGSAAILELVPISRAAPLCLAALISDMTHREIIDAPFFFLDDGLNFDDLEKELADIKYRPNPAHLMATMFWDACGYDVKSANLWRSDTLRLLNPVNSANSEGSQARLSKTNKMIEEICRSRAQNFARCLPPQLLRPMEAAMLDSFVQQLAQIFIDAGLFSVRMWSQRPSLRCIGLPDLAKEPFNISSEILNAHRLYKLDDPNDHRLDGNLTKIVVHPALLTYGTYDGDQYGRKQVLAKAVVWLDS